MDTTANGSHDDDSTDLERGQWHQSDARVETGERVHPILSVLDCGALIVVKAIVLILTLLPERIAVVVGRGIVEFVLLSMPRLKSVGRRNLELCFPELPSEARERILKDSFWVLARHVVTFAHIPELTKAKAEQTIDYSEAKALIDAVRIRNGGLTTGVILPTLHFGRFELLVQYQALLETPIAFLARGFGLPRLDRWWNNRRELFGNEVFTRRGGYQEIMRRLRQGQDVALLFDQNVKRNHATFADFFGIPAATTKTIGIAALRTGAPIIFAAMADIGTDRYRIITREIRNPKDDSGSTEEKIRRITEDLHRCTEEVIRAYPEQWFWVHRRFKTRPLGETVKIYSR